LTWLTFGLEIEDKVAKFLILPFVYRSICSLFCGAEYGRRNVWTTLTILHTRCRRKTFVRSVCPLLYTVDITFCAEESVPEVISYFLLYIEVFSCD
jgi:hypothetical protein